MLRGTLSKQWFLLALSGALSAAACGSSGGDDGGGGGSADAAYVCTSGQTTCEGNTFMTCVNNQFEVTQQCTDSICNPNSGCVECNPPGVNFCDGQSIIECDENGQRGGLVEICMGEDICSGGFCRNLCADAETSNSYIGCEYWAVDLDNAVDIIGPADPLTGCLLQELLTPGVKLLEDARLCVGTGDELAGECDTDGGCPIGFTCQTADACGLDAESSPFAVVVSNPQPVEVPVTITNQAGTTSTTMVPPGQVATLFPQQLGFPDQSVFGSGVGASAYKITSTAPVVAYQFNPLDNVNVFSNDGSLLIPRHTFDTGYFAMSFPTFASRPDAKDRAGYTAAVAWKDGTEVTVTPSVDVRAGLSQALIPAGTPTAFTLNAFDVLNLEAVGDGDLTGTKLEVTAGADATIGVFSGHEAAVISDDGSCCADHLEEMMFPSSTWGTEYAIARSEQRTNEADVLRILAQTDNTSVTLSSGSCPTLDAGQFCEVEIQGDVEITATEPVLVGHYLKSVIDPLFGMGNGDPSLAIAVPVEQFRSTYTFLVPMEYDQQFISVVAANGAAVTLDGQDISGNLTAFGANNRVAGRISVAAGQHNLECTGGCGVEVYGYSDAVSYLFAAGLDLEAIVVD